jgi:hypothetical protein
MTGRFLLARRLVPLLLLVACNEGPLSTARTGEFTRDLPEQAGPTAGAAGNTFSEEELLAPDTRYLAQFQVATRPEQAQALIGPEGGSLRAGEFEVVVPAGAVLRPTLFRIRLPSSVGKSGNFAYAEFEAGSVFLLPVTIRLPRASTDAEPGAPILWWADDHWVPLPTTPLEDGRIEATTTHFSIYGTSLFKGITIVGG